MLSLCVKKRLRLFLTHKLNIKNLSGAGRGKVVQYNHIISQSVRSHLLMSISIVVHGGAGDISPDRFESARQGCHEAALVGWRVLQVGGSALDAVEAAVRALEDNPAYNAGTGACLSADGNI